MPTNDFLPFGIATGANVMSQSDYVSLVARALGFSSGTAKSMELNKVWRQCSVMSSVVAQYISDTTGQDVLDNGNTALIKTNLAAAISVASVSSIPYATITEAAAGTATNKVMSPARTLDAIKSFVKTSSETVAGIIRIATSAEVTAGTNDLTSVTPKKMADYVNAKATSVAIQGAFKNMVLSASGTDFFVSISIDELVVENSSSEFKLLRSLSASVSVNASGANGLDTGGAVADTWYSVWIIATAAGSYAGLISLSATSPTLPSGYTFKARIGWAKTDSSRFPLRFSQYGRSVRYDVGNNVTAFPTVASGVASAAISVSISSVIPPTARKAYLVAGTSNGGYVGFAPAGSFVSTPGAGYLSPSQPNGFPFAGGYNASSPIPTTSGEVHLRSSNVMYCATGAQSILQCMGWEDNL